jgi:putative ABC transport system permease protein
MFVVADDEEVRGYDRPDSARMTASRGEVPEDVVAAVISLVGGTIMLFLVALIAGASFTVIAQRRLPQLGMLSAVGATEKHLRLTMLASGAVTGIVAAVLGLVVGIGGWLALEPRMERVVGYRIDRYDIPWWLVAAGMVLAVVAATGAAWWPGRTMSRIPPVLALSGRPPRPPALHRSALVAMGVLAVGVTCLSIGSRNTDDEVSTGDLALLALGTVGLIAGVLLVSPIAVRAVARVAGRVPFGPRVALRDLGRYQARSAAAVAAIGLALGIPVTIVAASAAGANASGPGNLGPNQLLVGRDELDGPFIPEGDDLAALQAGVDELVSSFPSGSDPAVVRLDVAKDHDAGRDPSLPGVDPIFVGQPIDHGWNIASSVFVATPELLEALGLDSSDVTTSDDIVTRDGIETSDGGALQVLSGAPERPGDRDWERTERVQTPGGLPAGYTSLPGALITPERVDERNWEAVPSGQWLIETSEPLTNEQLSRARDLAARHELTIQDRDVDRSLVQLRFGAVTVGLLLALGIVAMTVGLIRSESSADMRTLTATGATSATRRNISATTTAALAMLGAGLGIVGAYLGLAVSRVTDLLPLPAVDLGAIAVGLPVVAAAAGWLLAGREPAGLSRQPID